MSSKITSQRCDIKGYIAEVRRRVVNTATTTPQPRMAGVGARPQGLPHQTPIFTPRPLMTPQATPVRPGELLCVAYIYGRVTDLEGTIVSDLSFPPAVPYCFT